MPTRKKTHEEYRSFVCFLCLRKNLDGRKLNEACRQIIIGRIYPNFLADESFLPNGICSGCRRIMSSQNDPDPTKRRRLPGELFWFDLDFI